MKLIKTIAISFLTLVTQITTAQVPYNGKHYLFSAAACDKEICCSRMSQQVVTYCHKLEASGIRHFFIVHDISTNTTKQFFLDPYYTPGIAIHPTTITINDMRTTEQGECWFCGKKTIVTGQIYYPGTGWLDETDEYGIVGHFNIDSVLSSSGNGNYELFTIQGTGGLTRIEPRGNYEQIIIVGYPYECPTDENGNPTASCLVGLGYNYSNFEWRYDIVHPSNTNEIFTDVAEYAGFVVVSRFRNDHYNIGLRHTKNGPLRDSDYLSLLSNSNVFNMQLAANYNTGNPVVWRNDNDPIFLASDYNGSALTMAHTCDNISHGIAAYQLSVPNLGDVQIIKAKHIPYSTYLALLDCKENGLTQSTNFLVDDNSNNKYSILSIDWLSTFTLNTLASCSKNNYHWQSLALYNTSTDSFKHIAGHNPSNVPMFTKHIKAPSGPTLTQCISWSYYSIQNITTPTPTNGNTVYIDPVYNNHLITPLIGNFTSTTVIKSTQCTY